MTLRRALLVAGVIGAALLAPATAGAHPLGNFTVNTSAAIVLTPGAIRVDYVVDMAEIPTVQARPELDADGDGLVTTGERSVWASETAAAIVENLSIAVDGEPVELTVGASRVELVAGQGGLDVLRLEVAASGDTGTAGAIAFGDANFPGRVGWHEVTAVGADGVVVTESSVPAESPTDRLRTYPEDLLSSPMDVRDAAFAFGPGGTGASATADEAGESATRPAVAGGAFAGLVGRTGPLMVFALALAFGFGALHALGPGHGKTLMAAYLVGSGGRLRQAVAVGGAVALMHTASVLALGFVVLTATEAFAPERVYPWLSIASGLIALGLGAALLVSRLGAWGAGPNDDHHHDHGHDHPHQPRAVLSRRGLVALAAAGGILPSPTALVVLLGAVALHRAAYGLALIGAFSLGLATALVVVGLVAMRARDAVARRMSSRLVRLVPVASASAIAVLGTVLAVSGVAQL